MNPARRRANRVRCEIQVRGPVKTAWLDQISDLSLTDFNTADGIVSELRGEVVDQAALLGVLNGLDDLGLSLISISCRAAEPITAS